jgi:hypothetical protein
VGVAAFWKFERYRKAAHYCIVSEYRGRFGVTRSVRDIESAEPRVRNLYVGTF